MFTCTLSGYTRAEKVNQARWWSHEKVVCGNEYHVLLIHKQGQHAITADFSALKTQLPVTVIDVLGYNKIDNLTFGETVGNWSEAIKALFSVMDL